MSPPIEFAHEKPPPAGEDDEGKRLSPFVKNDEDVLHRMADVFQFGYNDNRSRCTSVDSGSLARREGDNEDFGEEGPQQWHPEKTGKAGRGEYVLGSKSETLKL